jgi:hypothetical protein
MTANRNAARKIEQAARRGWTLRENVGPARFLRRKSRRRARKQTGGRDEQ